MPMSRDTIRIKESKSVPSDLSQDEVYIGVVDRFSGSGNAIIEISKDSNQHLNLGPIDRSAKGEEVEFKYAGGVWCECLTEEYISNSYSPRDGQSSRTRTPKTISKSSTSSNPFSSDGANFSGRDNKNDLINGPM